ncbi:MAG: hypothetical protein U0174_19520 [Polyangiaceae bacterium]
MSNDAFVKKIAYDVYEKPLAPEEFERRVAEILSNESERKSTRELIDWFTKRYPTTEARLRYVRKHQPPRR